MATKLCGWTCYVQVKYAHSFVVLCFVVVMQSFIMNSHEVFIHIHQSCFAGTGAIVRLPQCQWSKPDGYWKISQCVTTTKHSKAKTVCIFLGIYCKCMKECCLIFLDGLQGVKPILLNGCLVHILWLQDNVIVHAHMAVNMIYTDELIYGWIYFCYFILYHIYPEITNLFTSKHAHTDLLTMCFAIQYVLDRHVDTTYIQVVKLVADKHEHKK